MKDKNHPTVIRREGARFLSKRLVLLLVLMLSAGIALSSATAQRIDVKDRINSGEQINYEVYFKWGLIMSKAGNAHLSIRDSYYDHRPAFHSRLLFKTTGLFEKVFPMRDTLDCYFTTDMLLLHSQKRVDDNHDYLIDDLKFSYSDNKIYAHSHRYNLERTKIDTVLVSKSKYMLDMLGGTFYLRSIDWDDIPPNKAFPLEIAIGRERVNMSFRYTGQQIIERGDKKYRTRHFYVDIFDEAFTQNKEAAEIWVGDDENHVPVKIRAKLKIGAAEVYYKSAKGLKYPFSCEVKMPRQ